MSKLVCCSPVKWSDGAYGATGSVGHRGDEAGALCVQIKGGGKLMTNVAGNVG